MTLFVRYTHLNRSKLPREIHINGPWIPVSGVNAQAHAKAAPAEAEWFQYFRQARPGGSYSPLTDVPMYFLDATRGEYVEGSGIQGVTLRHSRMRMPFYPDQPHRNAVISSR